jgi:hypothetical protein
MNNATDNKSSHWPVRNEAAAAEQQRTREMPLLFQLADINRPTAAVVAPPASAPLPPAKPAPIELPTPSAFPLASSALEPWRPTSSLFEVPTGLSTAALAIGAAAHPEKAEAKTAAIAASTTLAVETVAAEKLPLEKTAVVVSSGLPAAIESAVKAAAETSDAVETKTAVKAEAKSAVKTETKVEAKAETKSAAIPEAKTATKKETPVSTTAPAVETIVTAAATPAAEKPSPASLRRQRAEARQAKVEGKSGDWLSTHGKVIAICFVIALIGTIYLARRNRGSSAPAPSIETPDLAVEVPGEHKQDSHDHKPAEAANTAPRLVEAPSHPLDATPSPATTVAPSAPDATNTAELQSPVVPNAGQSTTPPSSEPLFPWQTDPRLATRPDAAPANAPTASAQPNNVAPTAPTLNAPTYPETNLRDAPLLPPAPPANSAPAPNYPAPGNGQGGSSGRVPASFSPASFTSAPGGNRYERTGSGLY